MPPNQSKADARAWTLLFKKHKTTVLLILQPHEPLISAKEKLLQSLKSRDLTEVNGDRIPDDPSALEFGAMDEDDPAQGWTRLDAEASGVGDDDGSSKPRAGKAKKDAGSLRDAGLHDGHSVAFRFRKPGDTAQTEMNLDLEDPGWDVVTPTFEDED